MKTITAEELQKKIELHGKWLRGDGGEQLVLVAYDLRGSDLSDSDLSGSDLSDSDLSDSDLSDSNLSCSNLSYSNLRGSDLSDSDLSDSDLSDSDLRSSYLSYSYLRGSDLRGSNLRGSNLPSTDSVLASPFGWCHVQREHIRIGCQYHTTEKWRAFTDDEINGMEKRALDWWRRFKPVVMAMAEACEPYETEEE